VASFLMSLLLSHPWNRSVHVVFDITWATTWLMSLKEGWAILRFFWQILLSALFSIGKTA